MLEKFESSNFKFEDSFRILNQDGSQKGIYLRDYAVKAINDSGLDGIVVNKNSKPIIVKLGDFQKALYEEKKKLKEIEKKRKASIKPVKEVKFHIGIAENDFNYKVQHIKDFLNDNCKVKVEIFLRGREVSMKDLAFDLLNNILTYFPETEYTYSKINNMNNIINIIVEKQ